MNNQRTTFGETQMAFSSLVASLHIMKSVILLTSSISLCLAVSPKLSLSQTAIFRFLKLQFLSKMTLSDKSTSFRDWLRNEVAQADYSSMNLS